ncbi:MAG: hypothetical protein RR086_01580 [Clostridia bacterium]
MDWNNNIFTRLFDLNRKMEKKRNKLISNLPEEMTAVNTSLGKTSITLNVFSIITSVGLPFLCAILFNIAMTADLVIIGNILLAGVALALILLPAYLAILAVFYGASQKKLNTMKIGKIAVIVSVLCIIVSICLTVAMTLLAFNGLGA